MGGDDLSGYRKPQSRILAKALIGPVGIKPLKYSLERVGRNSRSVIVDNDLDLVAYPGEGDANG